ncbi:MAG: cellulase family glycosylhydrolase [Archangium sp.]|nr:cellulase family glycosylhydrolase [Archangium sp.]
MDAGSVTTGGGNGNTTGGGNGNTGGGNGNTGGGNGNTTGGGNGNTGGGNGNTGGGNGNTGGGNGNTTGGGNGNTTGGGNGNATGGGNGNTTGGGNGNTTGGGNGNTTGGGNGNTTGGGTGNTGGGTGNTGGGTGNTGGGTGNTGGGTGSSGGGTGNTAGAWLRTQSNRILNPDGTNWHAAGANLHDTRSCDACTFSTPSVAEVNRRMDLLVDDWGANFIRLDLESYSASGGRTNWESFVTNAGYLADIKAIVAHAMTKPGLYVMLSLWIDPTFTSIGWPTANTSDAWRLLAAEFRNEPRVLFGLVNEPESNFNGAQDAQVWSAMNAAVQAIRDVEGTGPKHLVAVQGTREWSRVLDYYVTHPITAGGGANVIYETHVYDPPSQFAALFEIPSQTLPVIIGEFGPASGYMTQADAVSLMQRARAAEVPHLAWTFHQRCPPNLIEETAPGCGVNMALRPTAWGTAFKTQLAVPW